MSFLRSLLYRERHQQRKYVYKKKPIISDSISDSISIFDQIYSVFVNGNWKQNRFKWISSESMLFVNTIKIRDLFRNFYCHFCFVLVIAHYRYRTVKNTAVLCCVKINWTMNFISGETHHWSKVIDMVFNTANGGFLFYFWLKRTIINDTCGDHNGFTERPFSRVQTVFYILSTWDCLLIECIREYRVSTYLVRTSYGKQYHRERVHLKGKLNM